MYAEGKQRGGEVGVATRVLGLLAAEGGSGVVRRALAGLDVASVVIEGEDRPGLVLSGDLVPVAPVAPWVALLPALDATTMGWKLGDTIVTTRFVTPTERSIRG